MSNGICNVYIRFCVRWANCEGMIESVLSQVGNFHNVPHLSREDSQA